MHYKHRSELINKKNFHEIFYIVICINIDIEKVVNAKCEKKNFTTTIFEISKKEKNAINDDLNANNVVNLI